MKVLNFSYRILLHIIGYLAIGLGVVLIYRANQGAYPIDAMSFYLSELIPSLSIGNASIIINGAWVVLNFILIRKWHTLLSFLIVLSFGYIIDFWNLWILKDLVISGIVFQILGALGGLILLGGGIALIMFNTKFPLTPSEVFFIWLNDKVKSTVKTKLMIEATLITMAITMAFIASDWSQIGWFTVIAVLTMGSVISIFQKIFKKFIPVY